MWRALVIGLLASASLFGQADTGHVIRVHFLYGSKPLRQFKSTEPKYFGGIHGGHVTVQIDSVDYGFEPAKGFHVFSHHHKFKSDYVDTIAPAQRYPAGKKVTTFLIPISNAQYAAILHTCQCYSDHTPYDYAFLGMRCAASAQDVLSFAGVTKHRGRFMHVFTAFYPKRLRKRLFKAAAKNHYIVIQQPGSPTRKWERD